jgi:hypothetical protein
MLSSMDEDLLRGYTLKCRHVFVRRGIPLHRMVPVRRAPHRIIPPGGWRGAPMKRLPLKAKYLARCRIVLRF